MTDSRFRRINANLLRRQMDLTVCLEHVHKPPNVSAVLRTCDAVGIHEVNMVWNAQTRMRKGTAMGSQKWVRQCRHESIEDAVSKFRDNNMQVVVSHLSDKAIDFRRIDYTRPTAIILGQEKKGASEESITLADHEIVIPMYGMVQSLNVSVAGALILYEAQRQRADSGMYEKVTIPDDIRQQMLFEGCHPELFKQWQRKNLPWPEIDNNGEVIADASWWQTMQLTERDAGD
ncbi:MAG: tRNA (guanosine(18)-2'-O)-methyltransferase TrmH [Aestuariibacter sp.]